MHAPFAVTGLTGSARPHGTGPCAAWFGNSGLALPVAEKARPLFPQRSKNAKKCVSLKRFLGTARRREAMRPRVQVSPLRPFEKPDFVMISGFLYIFKCFSCEYRLTFTRSVCFPAYFPAYSSERIKSRPLGRLFSCHAINICLHPCGAVFLHLFGNVAINVKCKCGCYYFLDNHSRRFVRPFTLPIRLPRSLRL